MVSVIIGCYEDDRAYLYEAVLSTLLYPHWEVIIVDGSAHRMDKKSDHIIIDAVTHYIHVHGTTQSQAFNIAAGFSSGEWLFPLDADDVLMPYLPDPTLGDVVYGNYFCGYEVVVSPPAEKLSTAVFKESNPIPWSSFIRKDVFDMVGGSPDIMYQDYGLYCKLWKAGVDFVYSDSVFYKHNVRKDSLTHRLVDKDEQYRKEALAWLE